MKVKQVIEELQKFDPELDVVVDDIEQGFIDVEMVNEGFSPSRKEGEQDVIVIN